MNHDFPGVESLAYAYGGPLTSAVLKQNPQDFYVEENLHYELTGEGEHLYLYIEKKGLNTQDVKEILSRTLSVPMKNISEAGLKDKHALTRQWLSVHWPIKQEVPELSFDAFKVLKVNRHIKKLKRGAFGFNRFKLVLREIDCDASLIDQRLDLIATQGAPNYFGPQRFGHEQSNLHNACMLFEGRRLKRHARSLALSAARSFIFNQMLSYLLTDNGWPIKDITHGLLWGKANKGYKDEISGLAQMLSSQYTQLCQGLEKAGCEQSYRLLSVEPANLTWQWLQNNELEIKFDLPPGSYATVLLREVFNLVEHR